MLRNCIDQRHICCYEITLQNHEKRPKSLLPFYLSYSDNHVMRSRVSTVTGVSSSLTLQRPVYCICISHELYWIRVSFLCMLSTSNLVNLRFAIHHLSTMNTRIYCVGQEDLVQRVNDRRMRYFGMTSANNILKPSTTE